MTPTTPSPGSHNFEALVFFQGQNRGQHCHLRGTVNTRTQMSPEPRPRTPRALPSPQPGGHPGHCIWGGASCGCPKLLPLRALSGFEKHTTYTQRPQPSSVCVCDRGLSKPPWARAERQAASHVFSRRPWGRQGRGSRREGPGPSLGQASQPWVRPPRRIASCKES